MPTPGHARQLRLLALALLAAVVAGATLLQFVDHEMAAGSGGMAADEQMISVAPGGVVQLDELKPELAEMYLAVAEDPTAFEAVRCYCGCEAMLEHRHLLECFVRPDGAWERHAVACGICQVEAREVLEGRAAGTPLDDIVADIDATYGQITEETDA